MLRMVLGPQVAVYVLYRGSRPVYVGTTAHPRRRESGHVRRRGSKFYGLRFVLLEWVPEARRVAAELDWLRAVTVRWGATENIAAPQPIALRRPVLAQVALALAPEHAPGAPLLTL